MKKKLMELFFLFDDKKLLMDAREKYIIEQKNNLLKVQEKLDAFMLEMSAMIKQDKKRFSDELHQIKRVKRVSNIFIKRTKNMLKQGFSNVLIKPTESYVFTKSAIKNLQKEYDNIKNVVHDIDNDPLFHLNIESYERKLYRPTVDQFSLKNILLVKNDTCNICFEPITLETMALLECQHVKCRECIREIIEENGRTTALKTLNNNNKEIMFVCSFCKEQNYTILDYRKIVRKTRPRVL